jgi:hypothetical protein
MKRFALLLLMTTACFARDWTKFPAVVEVDGAPEVFAIGDAHSDYARLAAVMRAAKIIDAKDNWIAGKAVLVTTGDMIDKGPRALDVLRLMKHLRETAPDKGGRVIVLAGNHEAEFMADHTISKAKEFATQLKAEGLKPADVAACKGEIGEFLCSLPFAARVNDTYFSHGGNAGGRSISKLAADIEHDFDKHGYAAKELIGDGSLLEARLNGSGPGREVWIDAGLPKKSEKQLLQDYTAALGVKRIVEGHVPSPVKFADGMERNAGEMFQRFGLLFLIDTGMSEGVDNSLGAALHIEKDRATAICPNGAQTVLWESGGKQDFGRAAPCGR